MNIFHFILFVLSICFSGAYWWYCYDNSSITEFVSLFMDEDSFFAKFLSLVLLALSIGFVICMLLLWVIPLLPPDPILTEAEAILQSRTFE